MNWDWFVTGMAEAVPLIALGLYAASLKKKVAEHRCPNVPSFDYRVRATDLPESRPIIHMDSYSIYLFAKYGARDEYDWSNLLTVVGSQDGAGYVIEVRPK